MEFKVGDRVKVVKHNGATYYSPLGVEGVIVLFDNTSVYSIRIQFDKFLRNDNCNWEYFRVDDLELVNKVDNKQNCMQKLNSMLKRLLDKDSQALYKAGFIDGDLKLTSRGQEELNGIVFEANKTELVRLAQEQIVEDKEDK